MGRLGSDRSFAFDAGNSRRVQTNLIHDGLCPRKARCESHRAAGPCRLMLDFVQRTRAFSGPFRFSEDPEHCCVRWVEN